MYRTDNNDDPDSKKNFMIVEAQIHREENTILSPRKDKTVPKQGEHLQVTLRQDDIEIDETTAEQELISSIIQTELVRCRVHFTIMIYYILIDTLFDPGSSRTFIRKYAGDRVIKSLR